jgi:hypothetical protein
MAKLTSSMRNALPTSTFAGPGRSFPIPDKSHARAALQDIPKAKKLSPASVAKIRSKANAMLGK